MQTRVQVPASRPRANDFHRDGDRATGIPHRDRDEISDAQREGINDTLFEPAMGLRVLAADRRRPRCALFSRCTAFTMFGYVTATLATLFVQHARAALESHCGEARSGRVAPL
jgi:hypothetical protein